MMSEFPSVEINDSTLGLGEIEDLEMKTCEFLGLRLQLSLPGISLVVFDSVRPHFQPVFAKQSLKQALFG